MNTNNQDTLNEDKITKLEKPLTLFLKGGSNAIHNRNEVKSLDKGEIIHAHSEDKDHYIGNFAQPYGMLMIDMKFKKEDCEVVSDEEIKRVFCRSYSESDYKYWFGEDAI